eukprot:TRINITY_DN320_c0_g1_i4.p1 TRINITY_DN320_c0_g1~~TRINITY_DN320_c0_g1_i4.p1  ORF type:complete len:763 (+),score=94.63 TRINITY_DN320_c0_g1_i4:773-3061(+)
MRFDIWSFLAIIAISANIVRAANLDEFVVEYNANLSSSYPYSNDSAVIANEDAYCVAYRNTAGSGVLFGFGPIDLLLFRTLNVGLQDFFALASVGRDCYVFYALKTDASFKLYAAKNSDAVTSGHQLNVSPEATYTMSVVPDSLFASPVTFLIGISYSTSASLPPKLALIRYTDDIQQTDQFSDIDLYPPFPEIVTIERLSLHYYGDDVNIAVVWKSAGKIWAGTMLLSGTTSHFVATNSLPLAASGGITSRLISDSTGIICINLGSNVNCYPWKPNTAEINSTPFYSTPTVGSTPALGLLQRDPTATVLVTRDNLATFTARQFKDNQILSNNTLNITSLSPNVFYTISDIRTGNSLVMLLRDESTGETHLYQIRHNYCGDGIKNSFEFCDEELSCPDCLAFVATPDSTPFTLNGPTTTSPDGRGVIGTPNIENATGAPSPDEVPVSTIVPAIVVPVVVVAAGLIVLLLLLRRRKRRKGSLLHGKSRVEIAMESIDARLKIPYKSLVFKKEIGAGSYGKVYVGEWKGTPVAIKVSSSVTDMDGFFDEARITVGLQQHPNVVQTFGVSLDGQLPCIVLEFCEGGSLDNRLFDSDVTMTPQQKVALVKGVARGLYHLHTNNIVHRDLAARNVLLNKSGTPKISDFGMSRVLKSEAEKGKTKTNYGPIRWMAPESLRDLQYSTKSDVWSFGIVLYEIVSRNEPHTEVDPLEVAVKIKNESYHPSVPQNVDPVLREIMLSCWQPEPNNRPSMEQICEKLNSSFPDD